MRQAVIMAGGFGTRLRPLTIRRPKPMVPVLGYPIMEHVLRLLSRHGIRECVCLLYHQGEIIRRHFGDGSAWGVHLRYVQAEADYGTAGSVRNAAELLAPEPFVVISADVLTTVDLSAAIAFHHQRRAQATLVLTQVVNPLPYGIVLTESDGRIVRFLEKPSWGELFSDTVNTGIYILQPEVLELIPYRQEMDFGKELFPQMLQKGLPLYGYVADGYWRDIGNVREYWETHRDFTTGTLRLELPMLHRDGNVWYGEGVRIDPTATLRGCVLLGDGTMVGPHAELSDCFIGSECVIGPGSRVVRSILWDRVSVGAGTVLDGAIIASGVALGERCSVEEGAIVAEECRLGEEVLVVAGVKLWPGKVVEPRAAVTYSLVHEERWTHGLFLNAKVAGDSNVEITPEFATRFGVALGSAMGMGTAVVTSRDASNASRMVARAVMAGLMSSGVNVVDLQVASIPQTRQELRTRRYAGGVHVRSSPREPRKTEIIVLGADGRDIPSGFAKTVERIFYSEDFRRAPAQQVGGLSFAERSAEGYLQQFLSALNVEAIRQHSFRLLVDYSCGLAATLFPQILGTLGCQAFAVNNYVDPLGRTPPTDDVVLAEAIRAFGCELGIRIDVGAERISVMNRHGVWINPARLLTLMLKLFLSTHRAEEPYTVAVPVAASAEVEFVTADYNVRVVRVRNSHSAMMEATRDPTVRFVGGTRGDFIFPEYLFAADGMFSAAKLLEMIALTGWELSELDAELPRRYQREVLVPCPWERKGGVLRRAMECSTARDRLVIDGVKLLFDAGSVLIFPDRQSAAMVVIAEAETAEGAEGLAQEYARLVQQWQQ
ncbi:MAG: sugar phosphate nucleotidyltransferase [Bacteroidota bacterium]|nr:sugar phosphate nucleotidyltransferase [Bacteroidota bacterium]